MNTTVRTYLSHHFGKLFVPARCPSRPSEPKGKSSLFWNGSTTTHSNGVAGLALLAEPSAQFLASTSSASEIGFQAEAERSAVDKPEELMNHTLIASFIAQTGNGNGKLRLA